MAHIFIVIYVWEVTMQRYQKLCVHDGVCVAKFIFVMPDMEAESRMAEFYREVYAKCEGWFDEKLVASAIDDYESSEDPRKKWRWTPHVFCINCSFSDKDNKRICSMNISLSDNKENSELQRIHVWNRCLDRICKMNVKKLSIANID